MRRIRRISFLQIWYTALVALLVEAVGFFLSGYMAEHLQYAVWEQFRRDAAQIREVSAVPYAQLVNKYAQLYGVNPELVAAVIQTESSFQPRALSKAGAYGLMQVTPETWKYVNNRLKVCSGRHAGECTSECYYTPELNIQIGTAYLAEMKTHYNGDIIKMLAAYNAGPRNVDKYDGVPPYPETEGYIVRVVHNLYHLRKQTLPVLNVRSLSWGHAHSLLGRVWVGTAAVTAGAVYLQYKRRRSWRWR